MVNDEELILHEEPTSEQAEQLVILSQSSNNPATLSNTKEEKMDLINSTPRTGTATFDTADVLEDMLQLKNTLSSLMSKLPKSTNSSPITGVWGHLLANQVQITYHIFQFTYYIYTLLLTHSRRVPLLQYRVFLFLVLLFFLVPV